MSTLFVDKTDCELDVEGGRIVMRRDGVRTGTWPLALIERVVANRTVRVSGRLVAALSVAGIGLMFDAGRSREQPTLVSPAAADRGLTLAQYALSADPAERNRLAAMLIAARIEGAIALVAKHRPDDPRLARLAEARKRLTAAVAPPIASLRGIEGAAVAAFFEAFAALVPKPFVFAGRNRRPPRDPVNVCLSLGYALAQLDAVRAAALAGLDPAIGLYHEPLPGRASLACDLVEPARPLVEGWVLRLLASGEIGLGEFSTTNAACTLSKAGRRTVYRHFEDMAAEPIRARLEDEARALSATLRQRIGLPPGDAFDADV